MIAGDIGEKPIRIKENDMKIYHTATWEDYYSLMSELEEDGCIWKSGEKPTHADGFKRYGKDTYIYDEDGVIQLSSGSYFKEYYSNEPVMEYRSTIA
jgi:hypothetical protein